MRGSAVVAWHDFLLCIAAHARSLEGTLPMAPVKASQGTLIENYWDRGWHWTLVSFQDNSAVYNRTRKLLKLLYKHKMNFQ